TLLSLPSSPLHPPPPTSTLYPYTTLFRSTVEATLSFLLNCSYESSHSFPPIPPLRPTRRFLWQPSLSKNHYHIPSRPKRPMAYLILCTSWQHHRQTFLFHREDIG